MFSWTLVYGTVPYATLLQFPGPRFTEILKISSFLVPTSPESTISSNPSDFKSNQTQTDFIEYHISLWLWIYVSPVLFLFGLTGNCVSFVVLRSHTFNDSSIAFTLSALAIVDSSVLLTSLLRQWVMYLFGTDLRILLWTFGCKVHMFLLTISGQLSSWTLVLVTVERALCVCKPFIAKVMCTRSRIIIGWATIATLLLSINAHFLITSQYDEIKIEPRGGVANRTITYKLCYISKEYREFLFIWYWIDYVLLSVVPFLVILIGNTVITWCVVKAIEFRRQQQQQAPPLRSFVINGGPPPLLPGASLDKRNPMTSSTAMLVGISVLFLITTTPSAIYFLLADSLINSDPESQAKIRLAFTVTNLLYYTNNSANFLLYCLTGSRFRRALCDHFRRRQSQSATGNQLQQDRDTTIGHHRHKSKSFSLSRQRHGRSSSHCTESCHFPSLELKIIIHGVRSLNVGDSTIHYNRIF